MVLTCSHWPFIAWDVYYNAVTFADRNVNINFVTKTSKDIKILCCSHSVFPFLLLPMVWQRLWQRLWSNLPFWPNLSPYKHKNNQEQKLCNKAYAFLKVIKKDLFCCLKIIRNNTVQNLNYDMLLCYFFLNKTLISS